MDIDNRDTRSRFGRAPRPLPGVAFEARAVPSSWHILPLMIETSNTILAAPFLSVAERADAQQSILRRARALLARVLAARMPNLSIEADVARIEWALIKGQHDQLWGWIEPRFFGAYWAR